MSGYAISGRISVFLHRLFFGSRYGSMWSLTDLRLYSLFFVFFFPVLLCWLLHPNRDGWGLFCSSVRPRGGRAPEGKRRTCIPSIPTVFFFLPTFLPLSLSLSSLSPTHTQKGTHTHAHTPHVHLLRGSEGTVASVCPSSLMDISWRGAAAAAAAHRYRMQPGVRHLDSHSCCTDPQSSVLGLPVQQLLEMSHTACSALQ